MGLDDDLWCGYRQSLERLLNENNFYMKDNKHLTAYLDEYLKMDTPQFAVMITGKWGCGKTYYIKERINNWNNRKVNSEKDTIVLKPIYISVNGLSSIDSVIRKIKTVLNPILYSKGAVVAKKVALTALQVLTKSKLDLDADGAGEALNSLLDAEGLLEVFKSDSKSIKGNRVIIIDDLERCRINLDELFGFVNDIVEHSNSKVILICDEDKLIEVVKKQDLSVGYDSFKEKLVGQSFSLAVDYIEIAGAFIDAKDNSLLSANRALLLDLFVASKYENLRLIRRCLIDIERFFKQLPKSIETNLNYSGFVSNVMAYLTIASLEERFGNRSVRYYQSHDVDNAAKEAVRKLEAKYDSTLEKHGLYHSFYTIPMEDLIAFVKHGFIETPDYLVVGCRMLQSRNMANWEKLWRFQGLSNEEFLSILKKEKDRFYNRQLDYVFEVVHLAGILLSLEKNKLVKLSRKRVVSVAKKNVKAIFEKYPKEWLHINMNSQGYVFQDGNSSEMQEISNYADNLFREKNEMAENEYVVGVWNGLGTEITHRELDNLFEVSTPSRRCSYSYEAIFKQVRPKILAEKIISFSNASKIEFSSFLVSRYFLKGASIGGTNTKEQKLDKQTLEEISAILKKRAKRLKLIDKVMTLNVAKKIDEAVAKM